MKHVLISWTKYTKTFTIPSITGKTIGTDNNDFLQIAFWLEGGSTYNSRTDTLGNQNGTFEFAQLQIEEGSSATDFEFSPIGDTIHRCKRYYVNELSLGASGYATGANQSASCLTTAVFPAEMRVFPTVTVSVSGSGNVSNPSSGGIAAVQARNFTSSCVFRGTTAASGRTWFKAVATLDSEL